MAMIAPNRTATFAGILAIGRDALAASGDRPEKSDCGALPAALTANQNFKIETRAVSPRRTEVTSVVLREAWPRVSRMAAAGAPR